ncbi:unnamed protein product [Darwinula stevensoni]|uniref:Uncharacterized protein n=1 Tax=Darwinula stevensoni TaxID=69355 RepID=A0A7R8X4Y2_9CRUS|nr:unnamed protein product [Darwinula stevensoni]CAG0880262.1 unnamed protein product [Darwinula stevensoni]
MSTNVDEEESSKTKYKTYVSAVEKSLRLFEGTSDWPDVISALGKLNRVIIQHGKTGVVPRVNLVCKRLAQCLHPSLPSGVHLKALETYDIIFRTIGRHGLLKDFLLFSAGLFPLFGHANMKVRPVLLRIYEKHFLMLGEELTACLSGLLPGLFAGMDENSEFFNRTLSLLDGIHDKTGSRAFYTSLWKMVLENPGVRHHALVYVLNHHNPKMTLEDQLFILGANVNVTVLALEGCLEDSSPFVQRSALDVLIALFPLHEKQLTTEDLIHLVSAALSVLLSRDINLNRRLYSWLLTEETSKEQFIKYSLPLVVKGIQDWLKGLKEANDIGKHAPPSKAYKMLSFILENSVISPLIMDHIMLDILRSAFCHGNGDGGKEQELVKNVNMLFSSLDPSFLYEFCAEVLRTTSVCKEWEPETVQSVGHPVASVGEIVCLVSYLVDLISPDRDSSCLEAVLIVGTQNLTHLKPNNVLSIIKLCEKLMLRIGKSPSLALSIQYQNLFISFLQTHIFLDGTPIKKLNESLMVNRPMKPNEYLRENLEVWSTVFSAACRILPIFLISGGNDEEDEAEEGIEEWLTACMCFVHKPSEVALVALSALIELKEINYIDANKSLKQMNILQVVVGHIWEDSWNAEGVKALERLYGTVSESQKSQIEDSLCHLIHCDMNASRGNKALENFHFLWEMEPSFLFYRCTLLLLESLGVQNASLSTIAEAWLWRCFADGHLSDILDPLLLMLLSPSTLRVIMKETVIYPEAHGYAVQCKRGTVIPHIVYPPLWKQDKQQSFWNEAERPSHYICPSGLFERYLELLNREAPHIGTADDHGVSDSLRQGNGDSEGQHKSKQSDESEVVGQSFGRLGANCVTFVKSSCQASLVTPKEIVESIVEEILSQVPLEPYMSSNDVKEVLSPLHSHICLYLYAADLSGCIYAVQMLRTLLKLNPPDVTVQLMSSRPSNHLMHALSYHEHGLLGESFDSALSEGSFGGFSYLDIIVKLCLWYLRSYLLNQGNGQSIMKEDIIANREMKILSMEVLAYIFTHLVSVVGERCRSIDYLLTKCNVCETLLHILSLSVMEDFDEPFVSSIIHFNEGDSTERDTFCEALHINFLR